MDFLQLADAFVRGLTSEEGGLYVTGWLKGKFASAELSHERARCHVSRRVLAAVTLLQMVFWVLLLLPESAGGQAFWAKDTPKLPMAKTWIAQKAKLPLTLRGERRTAPDLQGIWRTWWRWHQLPRRS